MNSSVNHQNDNITSNVNPTKLSEEHEIKIKTILGNWMKRMKGLGELKTFVNDEGSNGGFWVFECKELEEYIAEALSTQKQQLLREIEGMKINTQGRESVYRKMKLRGVEQRYYDKGQNDLIDRVLALLTNK